jgi:hypothetical protein
MGNASMIAGMIAGSSPAIFYAVQRTMSGQPLEPSLPLGIRPMWLIGETMVYLLHGLPLLLGADPRPFVQLMSVGHPNVTNPLSTGVETLATAANNAVFIALLVLLVLWLCGHARELRGLGRLRPGNYSPAIFLGGAAAISLVLYVFGACTMNFSTIRYLVPLWAFIPGLIASLWISPRSRPAAVSAIFTLLIAWSVGQWIMHEQVGRPHPMRPLADTLVKRRLPYAVAEPLDAHLLSYMTGRRCKVAEFESFWVRLPHYQGPHRKDGCVDYVVDTSTTEWTRAWTDAAWPGTPPPETTRFLWPRLQHELKSDPGLLVFREPLGQGYELIRLRRALRPRGSRPVNPSLSTSGTQAADAATGSQIDG